MAALGPGALKLKAYPVDPQGDRIDVAFAYVGTTSMFEAAGFHRAVETAAHSAHLNRWSCVWTCHPQQGECTAARECSPPNGTTSGF